MRIGYAKGDVTVQRYQHAFATQELEAFEEYIPHLHLWFDVRAHTTDEGLSIYFRDITDFKMAEQERERQPFRAEGRVRRADGQWRWVMSYGEPRYSSDGKFLGHVGLSPDITELKQTEEALRKSEERFRGLVLASSDVLYRMSPDWSEMIQLNSAGFLTETLQPNPLWRQEYIHPDDQSRVNTAIDDAIRTKSVFELEHHMVRADGTLGWTFSRAVPMLDQNGVITEWYGAASDITARKQGSLAQSNASRIVSLVLMQLCLLLTMQGALYEKPQPDAFFIIQCFPAWVCICSKTRSRLNDAGFCRGGYSLSV